MKKNPTIPILGKYVTNNFLYYLIICLVDFIFTCFYNTTENSKKEIKPFQKILLSNGAHLGDVIVSTTVLPVLKRTFPKAEIGFLLASWSSPVLKNHPFITQMHIVDHWKLNRSSNNIISKFKQYWATRKTALSEIKKMQYDIAIELQYRFPTNIYLLWKAKIPTRIGYNSGGLGPLLTHPINWTYMDKHISEYQLTLLEPLPIQNKNTIFQNIQYNLPLTTFHNQKLTSLSKSNYIVIHPGSGNCLKVWPNSKWHDLSKKLTKEGHVLIFTGYGEKELNNIIKIISGLQSCTNLCNKLNWREFVQVISKCMLLITVDSVAGHLASVTNRANVIITTGMANLFHWKPLGKQSILVTHSVPCSPCYSGCSTMDCITLISEKDIYEIVKKLLNHNFSVLPFNYV